MYHTTETLTRKTIEAADGNEVCVKREDGAVFTVRHIDAMRYYVRDTRQENAPASGYALDMPEVFARIAYAGYCDGFEDEAEVGPLDFVTWKESNGTDEINERREYDVPAIAESADRCTFIMSTTNASAITALAKVASAYTTTRLEREFNSVTWTRDNDEVPSETAYLCVSADKFWIRSHDADGFVLGSQPVSVAELKDTFRIE